jgi:hypothetical protein
MDGVCTPFPREASEPPPNQLGGEQSLHPVRQPAELPASQLLPNAALPMVDPGKRGQTLGVGFRHLQTCGVVAPGQPWAKKRLMHRSKRPLVQMRQPLRNPFQCIVGRDRLPVRPTSMAAEIFPGLPLVGYESGVELAAAHHAGFKTVGSLRVWRLRAVALCFPMGSQPSLADPVPAVVSGSTSCGRGPNYGSDVMGQERTHALQKDQKPVAPSPVLKQPGLIFLSPSALLLRARTR